MTAEDKLKILWNLVLRLDERNLVLQYLLYHRIGNVALGSYKSISQETGLSISKVCSYLRILEEKDFIKRRGNGAFLINEDILPFEDAYENEA